MILKRYININLKLTRPNKRQWECIILEVTPFPIGEPTEVRSIGVRLNFDTDNFNEDVVTLDKRGKREYGLIAKLTYQEKKIFLFGGMIEDGTVDMGHYFRDSWEKIYNKFFNESDIISDFAMTFIIDFKIDPDGVLQYPTDYPLRDFYSNSK